MSKLDSSDDLRIIAKQYIETLWKADIHRDFDDLIKFVDGQKRQIPRPQEEIDRIYQQIEYYATFLADELVERWNEVGIYTLSDIRDPNAYAEIRKICMRAFSEYKYKVERYVKRQHSR